MYDLMLTCIILIAVMLVAYVALSVLEMVSERKKRKSTDGKTDKEVYVIKAADGDRIEVSISAENPARGKHEGKIPLTEKDNTLPEQRKGFCGKEIAEEGQSVAPQPKVFNACGNFLIEVAPTDGKSASGVKNENEANRKEKKFNSEYLILPEEYYKLSVTECYFYDEIVRFAYKCGANGRYRREGGEEVRNGDTKIAEIRIIGGKVYCAVGGEKLKKIGTFQNLQSVKNAMESTFSKK